MNERLILLIAGILAEAIISGIDLSFIIDKVRENPDVSPELREKILADYEASVARWKSA